MIARTDAEFLFNNPDKLIPHYSDAEQEEVRWFLKLTNRLYYNKGYWVSNRTWRELDFPQANVFALEPDIDNDLAELYKNFAWRGFLTYCQPILDGTELKGFAYKGTAELNSDVVEYMLRFPSIDWLNSTLLNGKLTMTDDLYNLIDRNKTSWSRDICAEFKQVQSRIYAMLYLMDSMPFIVRSYGADFENTIDCYTRNPVLIRAVLNNTPYADQLIQELECDRDFDTPISGIIKCVKLTAEELSGVSLNYTAELVDLDIRTPFMQLIPYPHFKAYTDGFSARIDDMPNAAAQLTLDLQKSGTTQRYCTLNKQVLKAIYKDTSMLKVNTRARFNIGLDIADFSFKYWNLQSSVHSDRSWSGFSPFSLRGVSSFNFSQLSKGILNADYDLIYHKFRSAVQDGSHLSEIATVCGIDNKRPALEDLLMDYMNSKHPSELYMLMSKNKALFNIA